MKTDALEAIEMLMPLTWKQASDYSLGHNYEPPPGWTIVTNIDMRTIGIEDWCYAHGYKGYLVRNSAL